MIPKGTRVERGGFGRGTVKAGPFSKFNIYAVEFDNFHHTQGDCKTFGGPHCKAGHGAWCEQRQLIIIP